MMKVGVTEIFREDNLPSGIVSRNLPCCELFDSRKRWLSFYSQKV